MTFVLSDPVNVDLGLTRRAVVVIKDDDPLDPSCSTTLKATSATTLTGTVGLTLTEVAPGGPLALPGQQYNEYVLGGPLQRRKPGARVP